MPDGTPVERYLLDDGTVSVAVLTLGGVVQELLVPDRDGRRADVALGFDDLAGYLQPQQPYLGALIGRYANRIAGARFSLNGTEYRLPANLRDHHLHGGPGGFHTRVWQAEPLAGAEAGVGAGVRLRLVSPDGDQGYPARLELSVQYTVSDGELWIHYAATNTEPAGGPSTVLNLTNHAYFQLAGESAGSVGGHVVQIPAARYARSDADLIPTGEIASVEGTPLDLREPRRIDAGWDAPFEQIANAGGYDHGYLLEGARPGHPVTAARIGEPGSGRVLEVLTDQPVSHFYSGNMMDGAFGGKGGRPYPRRSGFCLETQHLPDSPHHPAFPSTELAPHQTFRTTTTFRFTTTPP
jgi:aldose 1-epimerase